MAQVLVHLAFKLDVAVDVVFAAQLSGDRLFLDYVDGLDVWYRQSQWVEPATFDRSLAGEQLAVHLADADLVLKEFEEAGDLRAEVVTDLILFNLLLKL